ncbi:MAG: EamA family transporter [Betaproteobacteria bacterium]|jgi:drug/metabolite transporter (DMT)-like permease|nr:EamA family transporter [Betaproteobacteria bacterium]
MHARIHTFASVVRSKPGILAALGAAALFGASTPLAKLLVGELPPALLAGLLYLGSGIGLLGYRLLARRDGRTDDAPISRADLPWLAGAIVAGGIVGPLLLMFGLRTTSGSAASLLLNLEAVFTAALAWFVFRENFDRRIVLGMALIVAGGVALAWQPGDVTAGKTWGAALVGGACFAWGIDNNLTRKVSASDAVQIAGLKGLAAGAFNTGLALALGVSLPDWDTAFAAGLVGLAGYGVSLALFVVALRHLGTARTGAYFSVAPFFGAAIALGLLGESAGAAFWVAALLMAAGVWLHLTERHDHLHEHGPLTHNHRHVHDEHHRHSHDGQWDGTEPHTHEHAHEPLVHRHPHYPDLHHRHRH